MIYGHIHPDMGKTTMIDTRIILALALSTVLIIGFYGSGRRFSSPVIFFTVPFIIQAINSLYYPWTIKSTTFFIVISGSVVFALSCSLVHFMFNHKQGYKQISIARSKKALMSNQQYILLIFLTLLAIVYVYHSIKSLTVSGSINSDFSDVIGEFNSATKAGNDEYSLPFTTSTILFALYGASYAYAYIFAASLKRNGRRNWHLPCILFVTGILGTFLSGNRTEVLGPIITFILFMLMLNEQSNHHLSLKNIPIRIYIISIILIIVILLAAIASTSIFGRDASDNPLDYFSIYVGAPLQNLDYAVNDLHPSSDHFGVNTFRNIYPFFEKIGLVPEGSSVIRFPFVARGIYFTGNVYTIYYALLLDFGFSGCLVAIFIMGAAMQFFYECAIRRMDIDFIPISCIIYGALNFYLFMSYFSTNFFQNIFTTGVFKTILGIVTICLYQHICNSFIIVPKQSQQMKDSVYS